jgi:hypothetical protein
LRGFVHDKVNYRGNRSAINGKGGVHVNAEVVIRVPEEVFVVYSFNETKILTLGRHGVICYTTRERADDNKRDGTVKVISRAELYRKTANPYVDPEDSVVKGANFIPVLALSDQ